MASAIEIDALVVFVAGEVHCVGAIEHHVARPWTRPDEVEQCAQTRTLPLADAAPSLDAVVPCDLSPRGQLFELCQREASRAFNETADLEAPNGKVILREALVIGVARFCRPVSAEFGGK